MEGTRRGRLPYYASLDGLRACAVVGVVLYHANLGIVPGGFLGVEVFFVISGYLITSLLLAEYRRDGAIDLRAFWLRRARRLLPAFLVVLLATLSFTIVVLPSELAGMRGDAVAALGYVANWYQIFQHRSYFAAVGRPSPLQHFWSLAVEEQFYLVWPLALAALLRRHGERAPRIVAPAVALLSSAAAAYLYQPGADPSRVYYGTDTRAAGLMVGAALAFVCFPGWRSRRVGTALLDLVGFGSAAVLLAAAFRLAEFEPLLYRGGLVGVDLATALLLATLVHRRPPAIAGLLRWEPLRWIGVRSYGIYLWHWPIFALTRSGLDVGLDGWPLLAVRLTATVLLAEVSYRRVEMPIRNGALGRAWRACRSATGVRRVVLGAQWASGAGVVLSGVVLVGSRIAVAQPMAPPPYLAAGAISAWPTPAADAQAPQQWAAAQQAPLAPDAAIATPPQPDATATAAPDSPPVDAAAPDSPLPDAAETAAPDSPPADAAAAEAPDSPPADATAAEAPDSPPAGDAETAAESTSPPLSEAEAGTPPEAVSPAPAPARHVAAIGDSVMLGAAGALQSTLGQIDIDAAVNRQVDAGIRLLAAHRAAGGLGDVVIIHLGNNGFFSTQQFDALMRLLADVQRVVIVTVKVPRPWEAPNNAVLAGGVARYANAVLADWRAAASGYPSLLWTDGIHLRTDGAQRYAGVIAAAVNAPPPPYTPLRP